MPAPADPAPTKTELEFSIEQAREQLRLAELEHLPSRRRVHLTAAQHWIRLAERARRVQKGRVRNESLILAAEKSTLAP